MIKTLSREESVPSNYPAMPSGLSTEAQNIPSDAVWQRIEGWIAYRWTERQVTWVLEGPGEWEPELKPYQLDTTEVWRGDGYENITLQPGPLGYRLEFCTYKIKATVGINQTPPEAVLEAYRRYAEYVADTSEFGYVATSGTQDIDGALSLSMDRPASWQAKAMHYSGAADLLRAWRS